MDFWHFLIKMQKVCLNIDYLWWWGRGKHFFLSGGTVKSFEGSKNLFGEQQNIYWGAAKIFRGSKIFMRVEMGAQVATKFWEGVAKHCFGVRQPKFGGQQKFSGLNFLRNGKNFGGMVGNF